MRTLSLNRPLDIHYKGRDIGLDTSGRLNGHVSSRRPIIYGASIREFAYAFTKASRWPSGGRRRTMHPRYQQAPGWYYNPGARGRRKNGSVKRSAGGRRYYVPSGARPVRERPSLRPSGGARRCTVKIGYSNSRGPDTARSNMLKAAYIAREEATIAKRPFYEDAAPGAAVYTIDRNGNKAFMSVDDAGRLLGEDPIFRIILSPEDPGADLTELASRFMKESFSKAVASRCTWVAANHYNTKHPHVHILVSRRLDGKDIEKGRTGFLAFSRDYVKKGGARRAAGRILTSIMGERTAAEERRMSERLTKGRTYGWVDQEIQRSARRIAGGRRLVGYGDLKKADRSCRDVIKERLRYLSTLSGSGVSYDRSMKGYVLEKGWDTPLRRQSAIEEGLVDRSQSQRLVFEVEKPKDGTHLAFKGRIVSVKAEDDDPDSLTFTIEDPEGRLHLITETVDPDVEREKLKGKEAAVGFFSGKGAPRLLNRTTLERMTRRRRG